jgi:hypothetical protein
MRLSDFTTDLQEVKLTGPYRPRRTAAEKFRAGMKRAGYDMDAAAKRMQDFLDRQAQQRAELDQKYAELDQRSKKLLEDYDQYILENLRKWFREKWVRFGPDGKIRGDCARGDDSEGKPKCLPQAKAHALGKKGRKTAASRKRREDPNPERSGSAINVKTKESYQGMAEERQTCPECGGPAYEDQLLAEKQDACYHKVKSRYKVWPSAYASGALVQCRKKGARNWGNKSQ